MSAALGGESVIRRVGPTLRPDPSRTILRPFVPGQELVRVGLSRADAVVSRVLDLTDDEVTRTLSQVVRTLSARHSDVRRAFRDHADQAGSTLPLSARLSPQRRELLGAYLTQEYALEAAAVLNPTVVRHPDQSGLPPDELRFVLGLRVVGEGHISSLEWRTGVVTAAGAVRLHHPGRRMVRPRIRREESASDGGRYRARFPVDSLVGERVLFPASPAERHGIEDLRLVRFAADDGSVEYRGTYTAYDGTTVASHLLRTTDFRTFDVAPMAGPAARDKGMALFPRTVGGRLLAVARRDRESLVIAWSEDGLTWSDGSTVQTPRRPWELIQLGSCAPPLETPEGWLVVTHGVGPVRHYTLGALLLDLDDPTRVRGVLDEPLLAPTDEERIGYVPNVVYTCGALLHGDLVFLPYACSDSSVRFAVADTGALLDRLA